MTKIYLDMDDVLVDFSGGLEAFNIKNDSAFIHKPRSEWTLAQKKLDRAVVDCMNTPGFFLTLPPKKGYRDLWKTAEELFGSPYTLTAWPKTTKDIPRIKEEKLEWMCREIGPQVFDNFICCAREDKAKYAWEGHVPSKTVGGQGWVGDSNILVDDMEANIHAWEAAGGIGILYTSAEQAIAELRKLAV